MRGSPEKIELLTGFAGSSGQAAAWLREILKSDELKGELPRESRDDLHHALLDVAGLDMEQRLEILTELPGYEDRSRQELLDDLVGGDVVKLLEIGRDWRFEFRNGKASLDDVLTAVRRGLPNLPDVGEEALRVTLYRELAEENPKKALPLLDPLPPEKRRGVLFDSTWLSFVNVSPDDFLRFLADVPDAKSADEQERKLKGWSTRTPAYLWRYGDDYIEWVKQMPPGIHREAAMNSILLATAGEDPARARALSEQFYPRKP